MDRLLRDGAVAYRPGLAVVVGITHSILGMHMGYHLALAVLLGVLVSEALYALLRSLRLEPLHAGLISGLVLLFPFVDAARMWASAPPTSSGFCSTSSERSLTPARFVENLRLSVKTAALRIPGDPLVAAPELCGPSG